MGSFVDCFSRISPEHSQNALGLWREYRKMQPDNPNYTQKKKLAIDSMVDIHKHQIEGWLIKWAQHLNKEKHAGFAALNLAFAYFEGHMIFYKGEDSTNNSKKFFKEGIEAVFPFNDNTIWSNTSLSKDQQDDALEILYKGGRCGAFHSCIARKGIVLWDNLFVFYLHIDENTSHVIAISIDRHKFVSNISKHFLNYIKLLQNPKETILRENFEKALIIFENKN